MDFLQVFLPIVLFILGIVLLVVLIVLAIKMIDTVDKMNRILENTERKINSFNGVFRLIDSFTDNLSFVGDRMIETIASVLSKIFKPKKRKSKYEEDDEYYE